MENIGQADDLHTTVVENLFDGVYYVDRQRTITYWNPAAERITGHDAASVVGRHCFDNILGHVDETGKQLCQTACPLVRSMAQGRGIEADIYLHHRTGHRVPVHVRCQPVRDPEGTVIGAVEIFSEDVVHREALARIGALEQLASIDALTGLPNRRTAELALRGRLADLKDAAWPLAMLFLDIDRFKQFNDTHGHAVGDDVLRVVGQSLTSCLRAGDLAARWGGEEFVILTASENQQQLESAANRIRSLLSASTVTVDDGEAHVTVSIGATLAVGGDLPDTFVARADGAMYASKTRGRDRVTFAA